VGRVQQILTNLFIRRNFGLWQDVFKDENRAKIARNAALLREIPSFHGSVPKPCDLSRHADG